MCVCVVVGTAALHCTVIQCACCTTLRKRICNAADEAELCLADGDASVRLL